MAAHSGSAGTSKDRLVSTLFLVTLFHGIVIMGITFTALPPAPHSTTPTLEVIISPVQQTDDEAPERPDYLARANQAGGGNTPEHVRPASEAASMIPIDNPGRAEGAAVEESRLAQVSETADLLVTRSVAPHAVTAIEDAAQRSDERTEVARQLHATDDRVLPTDEQNEQVQVYSHEPREIFISANTRESDFAEYLAAWKRKVEKLGTLNFPDEARRRHMSGSPTLEVAIKSDGALHEIVVRESSGHKLLDQAALSILRLAAPFDPFPRDIRDEYEILRFAYEWQFIDGAPADAVVRAAMGGDKM